MTPVVEKVALAICKRRGAHRIASPCKTCISIAEAALASLSPGDVLPNWLVVVPSIATKTMVEACTTGSWRKTWEQMIEALTALPTKDSS